MALLAVQPDVRAARQNPPVPAVDAPPPFDQWLENLIREAHERGYSDTLVDQTPRPRRCRASSRTTALRPSSSSDSTGTIVHASMRGSCSRDARWPASTADCCRASKENTRFSDDSSSPSGDRNALRPREGQYARLPGAGHAGGSRAAPISFAVSCSTRSRWCRGDTSMPRA